MKLTVLGCWGAYPYNKEGTSSYLLETDNYRLLIDAGSATLIQLEAIMDPMDLDAVILSHYHYDHIADLGVLQYYRQLKPLQGERPLLPIYGHMEDSLHFEELSLPKVSVGKAYKEFEVLELGPFSITFLRTKHPVTCFAMRIVEKDTGKVLLYTGDSGYITEFIPFCKNADVLLIDTYLFEGNERHFAHFTSKEAGELAKESNCKQLILTHLPQYSDLERLKKQAENYCGATIPVKLAKQGLTLEI